MPITELGVAAIAAGAGLAGQGINAYASGKTNKNTREWNEKQYHRTRRDALSDWYMANEYNSPREQMRRFRDAGLNPNLIYGQTNTADAVRSSDMHSWNPRSPQVDLGSVARDSIAAYQNTKMQEAQMDLIAEQARTQQQQQANIAADTANKTQDWTKNKWAAENASQLGEISLQAAKANLRKTDVETTISLNRDQREAALNSSNLKEALSRIANISANTAKTEADKKNSQELLKSIQKDIELKELDLQLKRQGIQPNDPLWMRIINQQWNKFKDKLGKIPSFLNAIE